ncbi:hypothetical protein RUND412_006103 [Rhizina undulata]
MSALPTPLPPPSTLPPVQESLALSPINTATLSPDSLLDYPLSMQEETPRSVDNPVSSLPTLQVDLEPIFLSAADDMLSSSPSVASSSKRCADDVDVIPELIRKAKASRFAAPVRPLTEEDEETESTLEQKLACPICAETFYDPVECLECSHTFCGSCIVQWLKESDTCPTCRRRVTSTKDSAKTTTSLEYFYNAYPARKFSDEEIAEKEAIYKPGQEITIIEHYSDGDDEYDEEGDEAWFADNMDNRISWQQCLWCESPNEEGFICPEPIPPENPETGPIRSDSFVFRGHVKCEQCERTIPTTWKDGWECRGCGDTWCGNFWNCESSEDKKHLTLAKDQTVLFVSSPTAPANPIGGNRMEEIRISQYIVANGITWDDVGKRVRDWLFEKHGSLPCHYRSSRNNKEDYHFLPTDYICRGCMHHVFQDYLMRWWFSECEKVDCKRMCYERSPECPYSRHRGYKSAPRGSNLPLSQFLPGAERIMRGLNRTFEQEDLGNPERMDFEAHVDTHNRVQQAEAQDMMQD